MSIDQALRELQESALRRGWFDTVSLKMSATRWVAEFILGYPSMNNRLFASDEDPEIAINELLDKVRAFEKAESLRMRA